MHIFFLSLLFRLPDLSPFLFFLPGPPFFKFSPGVDILIWACGDLNEKGDIGLLRNRPKTPSGTNFWRAPMSILQLVE